MDDWVRKRALKNEKLNFSRTFVLIDGEGEVGGYYTLCAATLRHEGVTRAVRRNAPKPIPAILLGQISVSEKHQGKGISRALLQDVFKKTVQISEQLGARVLLLNAIDENAENYWSHIGFSRIPNGTTFYFDLLDLHKPKN